MQLKEMEKAVAAYAQSNPSRVTDEAPVHRESATAKIVPIYPYPLEFAKENGEIEAWRQSMEANRACLQDIDKAVHDSYLGEYRYDLNAAVKTVIDAHGFERLNHVLANILLNCHYDGRYSGSNKEWARNFGIAPDRHIYCNTHPAILDGFIDRTRKVHCTIFLDAIGRHEQSRHIATRNRLTHFKEEAGEFRPNPGVTDARLMARYGEIMEMKLAREQRRGGATAAAKDNAPARRESMAATLEAAKQAVREASAKAPAETNAKEKKSGPAIG